MPRGSWRTALRVAAFTGSGPPSAIGLPSAPAFPREIAELSLAHAVGTKVEQAYHRTDLFDKRRKLMDAWAQYCAKPSQGGDVIPIGRVS